MMDFLKISARRSRYAYLVCGSLIGVILSSYLRQINNPSFCIRTSEDSSKRFVYRKSGYLCVIIISSPYNYKARNSIRKTWAKTIPTNVSVNFFIGTMSLSVYDYLSLMKENSTYQDMILLDSVTDSYENLTEKMLEVFNWVTRNVQCNFILKVDDDTFVQLNKMVDILQTKPEKNLYLGYISEGAPIVSEGKWAETKFSLCQTYLPYAVGGGYVLSYDLILYIVENSNKLERFKNEDVSLGTWLAPLKVNRIDDPAFNMGGLNLGGCSDSHVAIHPVSDTEMDSLDRNLYIHGTLCGDNFRQNTTS